MCERATTVMPWATSSRLASQLAELSGADASWLNEEGVTWAVAEYLQEASVTVPSRYEYKGQQC